MSVIVLLDQADGQLRKAAYEAATYASDLAAQLGSKATGLVLGACSSDLAALGNYGLTEVLHVNDASLALSDTQVLTAAVEQAVAQTGATIVVCSHTTAGKALAPRLSIRLKAGLVAGAVGLPDTSAGFVVRKSVFSGKAFAAVNITSDKKIISLNPNAYTVKAGSGTAVVTAFAPALPAAKITLRSVEKVTGEVPLTEAEIVVSGGRGLKGPENWGLVTDLAGLLGAATACSRPVADIHWRPHHEHVGQTGIAIAPNLYIAIGISGAIQHLAGVNRSKTIVVINKDPEAPFFKAADYGIVGDAFEVVPKIIDAVKKLKSA